MSKCETKGAVTTPVESQQEGAAAQEADRLQQLEHENAQLKERNEVLEARIAEMDRLITVNPLTGLGVRRVFDKAMERLVGEALAAEQRYGLAIGLLRLDHDYTRIKDVRDRSRVLLFKTADRISHVVGEHVYQSDRIDEFLIIFPEVPNVDVLELRAEELVDAVAQTHEPPADDIRFSCFVGLAFFPDHGESKEELLQNADIALREAERGMHRTLIYDAEAGLKFRMRDRLLADLKHSVNSRFDGFSLHYQPLVNKRAVSAGAEALLRWESGSLGTISPSEFVPLAEESGIIRHLGHWALYQACRQLRLWLDRGYTDLYLSINLSPAQFSQVDLVERVAGVIKSTGLTGTSIHLELTETTIMADPEDAIVKLRELRALGIRLALDDFGTGYSSFTHLRQFPFDVLKIDRSFVTDIDQIESNKEIVGAMVDLARAFGLKSLAEGVEREEEFGFLVERGVDLFQGYLFSKPLGVTDYESLLESGLNLSPAAE